MVAVGLILSLQPPLCEPPFCNRLVLLRQAGAGQGGRQRPKVSTAPSASVQGAGWRHCPVHVPKFGNVMQNPVMPIMQIT